jgi:glycosyltransferase involved in cell wall biosynthesis
MLIVPALFLGGAEKQYRYIMESIAYDNRRIIVLVLNSPLKGEEEITKDFIKKHPQIEFHQIPGNVLNCEKSKKIVVRWEKIKVVFLQGKWLSNFLQKNQVDVVMFSYVSQLLITPLFNTHGTKVIFNERNTGRQICDKKFKMYLLKKCHRVIANSKYAADYVEKKTGIDVELVNNGIVEKHIDHIEHNLFVITVPARISRIKNQMLVLEALNLLLDKNKIHIIFVGCVEDEQYEQELKIYVEKHRLQENVEFIGYVNEMNSVYGQTDLLVLPSFEEGTPNVLLESYMYRILPLASNIPMNKDCCICNQLLFEPDNSKMLAEKIELARNGMLVEDVNNILDKNEAYVHTEYSMKNMKQKYAQLLSC